MMYKIFDGFALDLFAVMKKCTQCQKFTYLK